MVRSAPNLKSNEGMTLVELLVAVAVTSIIMGISIGVFVSQYKNYRSSHAVKSSQTDNQKAIDMIRDDFALAGWSVRPELSFYILDGGANAPDEIYINDAGLVGIDPDNATKTTRGLIHMVDTDCAACGRYVGATLQNSLDIDEDGQNDLRNLPVVLFWDQSFNRAAKGSTDNNGNLVASPSPSPAAKLQATPAVRYCVDIGNMALNCTPASTTDTFVLRKHARDTGGRSPMAEDVVDLQVVYQDDGNNTYGNSGCTTCQMASFNASKIKWLELSIVTRSRDRVRPVEDSSSCRPAVGNRAAAASGSTECGYEYRTYATRIMPFNRLR